MNHRTSRYSRSRWLQLVLRSLLAVLPIAIPGRVLVGQDKAPAAADDRNGRSDEMRQIAESLSAFKGEGEGRRPIEVRREPLLRWSDPTRKFSDASLWAWGDVGRPLAVVALELYPQAENGDPVSSWAFEFISLASEPLEFRGGDGLKADDPDKFNQVVTGRIHWAPTKPGLTWSAIPDGPPPAQKPAVRLAQMKDLLRRFGSTEHHANDRKIVLRPLPHPVHRYTDEAGGVVDGAIFVFATGTNPEVILLIEAPGPSPEKASWHFATARITSAPFVLTLDRREVWNEQYASEQRNPSASYVTARLPRTKK